MRFLKLVAILLLIVWLSTVLYEKLPEPQRTQIERALVRLTGKNFDWPPDTFSDVAQAELIDEYRRRGYQLKCYDALKSGEKIGKFDDYQCWFLVKSAFDNIPARIVTFSFAKQKLSNVRMEFPDTAFDALQNYLRKRLESDQRLDLGPAGIQHKDIFAKSTMIWQVKNGLVITSAEPTPSHPITLLWIARFNW